MKIEVLEDANAVALRAAGTIAAEARAAVARRGEFTLAVSGGATPRQMYGLLAQQDLPWERTYVFQVDERFAPPGSRDRNLTLLQELLISRLPHLPAGVFAMPVDEVDPEEAAERYAGLLRQVGGDPPVLDLIHLGLGTDGHTASLVPNDPVLAIVDADVAVTGFYQGHRRMTMTYPMLNRARRLLWVVTGADKAGLLPRLRDGDPMIPAARVRRGDALVLSEHTAAEEL